MDRQLFQHVCDVLDAAGFRMRDGARGLMVVSTPQGVCVGWRPGHTPMRLTGARGLSDDGASHSYGRGIQAAMAAAVASVLEKAGYCVTLQDMDLLVSRPGGEQTAKPLTSWDYSAS